MPFLRAGFNARNTDTGIRGWTRARSGRVFAVAELRRFACGDYFWYGDRPKLGAFLAWPELVVIGSWGIDLPYCWQYDLPACNVETRRENVPLHPMPETLEAAREADG